MAYRQTNKVKLSQINLLDCDCVIAVSTYLVAEVAEVAEIEVVEVVAEVAEVEVGTW